MQNILHEKLVLRYVLPVVSRVWCHKELYRGQWEERVSVSVMNCKIPLHGYSLLYL